MRQYLFHPLQQSQANFSDRLLAMNWVEKKHQKAKLIASQADSAWAGLGQALRESVITFNKLYRESRETADVKAQTKLSVLISLPITSKRYESGEIIRSALATVTFDPETNSAHCLFQHTRRALDPVDIILDSDAEETVFWRHSDDRLLDCDAVARVILDDFFTELARY